MKRHFENISKKIGSAIRHWWLMLVVGILAVIAGILVFVFPLETYVTLSLAFGILMWFLSSKCKLKNDAYEP